ncbi:hypothetical protein AGABI2DRAFT_207297 [Agaricus bisporus var. bisporus H97]|uniref:hypothetical protein n=1 Tax=Agaricus bisporus var. bisporus (strain H97 / ATCC MYA-4626 / FGSC 10389) TaxID=936046 RepID=UPI00029F6B5B|nr:hypothetical protein AGABI2DRAFT_207297 [Agaricus bisporus var. bisporus H97]EKV45902.1 hypothetical protein AGABI2DRAFT_207297 [Agaricus bisporus var. bisporus H97]
MDFPRRKYADDEKRQLIANLDIEVAHRTRQFESFLADHLENFTIHQEGQISRIPKQVRSMTMREFGEKYQGNIQAALRGYQKERLVAAGADADFGEIDKTMRKRKWVEGIEAEMEKNSSKDGEIPRAAKTARTVAPSPSPTKLKMAGPSKVPSSAQRKRLVSATNKFPLRSGLHKVPPSPSPTKSKSLFNTYSSSNSRPPSRPPSPTKPSTIGKSTAQQPNRVPSSSSFNPSLPPKTPKFPGNKLTTGNDHPTARLPRKDESMLSINGSPIVNPYQFGLGWFRSMELAEAENISSGSESSYSSRPGSQATNGRSSKSSIVIRRDPSVVHHSGLNGHPSQDSIHTSSSSEFPSSSHPRNLAPSIPQSASNSSLYPTPRFPTTHPLHKAPSREQQTPQPIVRALSALVAIPTKDGHMLEFDPLQASPGSIDALDGITESAKKQAKQEMSRLVQTAVDKWKIG